jgi:hypothetical protein
MIALINSFIDTVQGAKSQFLNTFVSDKAVRNQLQEIVDAQTSFTKVAAKNTLDIANKTAQEVVKFDATKFSFAK